MILRRRRATLLSAMTLTAATFATILTGCTPWATYPRVEGARELSHPTVEPVPVLMTEAIRWAHATHGRGRAFSINLPAETPISVYDTVLHRLGGGKPQTEPDEWTYHLLQVRSRGLNGEVDLLYPTAREGIATGRYEFITLHLRGGVTGWSVTTSRIWRIPFDVPAPNWRQPMDRASAAPQADEGHAIDMGEPVPPMVEWEN